MARTILVTGANGNISSNLIPLLRKGGAGVRAVVRNAKKADVLRAIGCDVRIQDFDEPAGVQKLFDGVHAAFLLTAPGPKAHQQMSNLIQGARTSEAHIVRLSALKAGPDAPTENGRLHHRSDQELINSDRPYTLLRPHFFFQNVLWSLGSIQSEGKIYQGMGSGKLGMVDVRDIADCAAAILLKGGHEGKIYTPTGPSSITWSQFAETIGDALGRPVQYVPVPLDAVRKNVLDMGLGDWFAQLLVDYAKAYGEGWGDFVTRDVETLTGKKPRGAKEFANEVLKGAAAQVAQPRSA